MGTIQCKMCGGAVVFNAGEQVGTCEYCGTLQTMPVCDNDRKVNLFNRANALRQNKEFDRAAGIYETIASEFSSEAEAYWGLCLCKYGIEYVDDAVTGRKLPTCHRTSTVSLFDDDDFEAVMSTAEVSAKRLYREEAKEIDTIQRKILETVASAEPYDIFLCYKEIDDETGARTEDSTIANDIYEELKQAGYRVFYARKSLNAVAGTDYEANIFAALRSSRLMLAIGTKYEYYDSVWVKNEWSRYLGMMKNDEGKSFIACYRNLDAYDIPKQFRGLQALNIGDVGFLKNLMGNVERLLPRKEETSAKNEDTSPNHERFLKRAILHLESGEMSKAEEYLGYFLDDNPTDYRGWWGFVRVYTDDLRTIRYEDEKAASNYRRAMKLAPEKEKAELKREFLAVVKSETDKLEQRIEQIQKEHESIADKAVELKKENDEVLTRYEKIYRESARLESIYKRGKEQVNAAAWIASLILCVIGATQVAKFFAGGNQFWGFLLFIPLVCCCVWETRHNHAVLAKRKWENLQLSFEKLEKEKRVAANRISMNAYRHVELNDEERELRKKIAWYSSLI